MENNDTKNIITSNEEQVSNENSQPNNNNNKNYNGFLRNSNRNYKNKKFNNKPKKAYIHYEDNENEIIENRQFTALENIFYYIRQRSTIYFKSFKEELNEILKTSRFEDLQMSEKGLLSYSCLYENYAVFNYCLNFFTDKISTEEINKCICISLNKNIEFLQEALNFYKNSEHFNQEFLIDLSQSCAKISYRRENNIILANLLAENLSENDLNKFFTSILNHQNISLLNVVLGHEKLHNIFNKHKNELHDLIDGSVNRDEVLRKLAVFNKNNVVDYTAPIVNLKSEPDVYLSNANEQLQLIQHNDHPAPTIIVKRRKKIQ